MLGLFSSVRGYNILMICLAQYLVAIFVLSNRNTVRETLFDSQLFMLVFAGSLAIAGGYIINGFYDKEKDLINKPLKTMIDRLVGQNTKLTLYFLLNFFSVVVASSVSFRAVIFFSVYIFALWFYSHRLKKILFIGNITSAILSIVPFFAIFVYYKNFEKVIFIHAWLLFFLILIKEFVKDLQNLKGDLVHNYQTIPVKYGEQKAKISITIAVFVSLFPILTLIGYFNVGLMRYYLLLSAVLLLFLVLLLWKSNKTQTYAMLHNLVRFVLILGVFSVLLIDFERFLRILGVVSD